MNERISKAISDSIAVKNAILANIELKQNIHNAATAIVNCYKQDGKVLFCGNGGSAADAQHLAAELSGRYYFDRPPLFAEALHVNTSFITAVANDYSFDETYARMIKAAGRKGDILLGLSTSGNSENVVRAFSEARTAGMITIAFTGNSGGKLKSMADLLLNIPSTDTPRIQEAHILIGHIICELVESELFNK
ncbi:MAG: D-sedoheptulose 7-phosphate isomerase [Bacteroidales bacterium]|nr:D-sedoheptulose 7-phosphate isomerase [Bacteroidales bacterium]